MGWLMARVIAPLAGYRRRVRQNLRLIWPDMSERDLRALCLGVPDNFGRTLAEIFSGSQFKARLKDCRLEGDGVEALRQAHAAGRPIILVSGHFGNHDAVRACVSEQFSPVGALYRPLRSQAFNGAWEAAISGIAAPIFPLGRRGLAEMVRYLKSGNIVALLIDQHQGSGAPLDFMGRPAMTALSAAEMALKYDALLLPVFGLRNPDGLSFRALIEAPIAPSDAQTMTAEFNARMGAMVTAYPAQWFWVHRRWKYAEPLADQSASPGDDDIGA